VSWNAAQSGMLAQFVVIVKEVLYSLGSNSWLAPGVRIGIMTFHRNVNFYNLSVSGTGSTAVTG